MTQRTPEQIALERIREAERDGHTNLDLSGLGLRSLPPEIGNLTGLTELYLSDNQLSSLPPEIGKLTSLMALSLYANQLTAVPREIGKLTKMTELWLDNNRLTSLPPELASLTDLIGLDLDRNPLTSPDPGVIVQGTEAVLAFLRQQLAAGSRRQWVSKLLFVGRRRRRQDVSSRLASRREARRGRGDHPRRPDRARRAGAS